MGHFAAFGSFGAILRHCVAFWGHVGAILGTLCGVLQPFQSHFKALWATRPSPAACPCRITAPPLPPSPQAGHCQAPAPASPRAPTLARTHRQTSREPRQPPAASPLSPHTTQPRPLVTSSRRRDPAGSEGRGARGGSGASELPVAAAEEEEEKKEAAAGPGGAVPGPPMSVSLVVIRLELGEHSPLPAGFAYSAAGECGLLPVGPTPGARP